MIARILYRESVHAILDYVLHKENAKILGFQNTSLQIAQHPDSFKHCLHFLGNRHHTKKRYTHITINLPHGEFISDQKFFSLASQYMEHMGYMGQPFVVVRHDDTKHEHVHIVSTTVKENNTIINLSNDYRRNIATQQFLEKEFGLMPSPETKNHRELPIHRLPHLQALPDDSNGVKFYIQDIINTVLQRHKVRSFEELAHLVKPYHILISPTKNDKARLGVSYGIEVNNGYKSRFINGYLVHPQLSGPKLEFLFKKNQKSKLLAMHKKRLEKQLLISYKLFSAIRPEDIVGVLKTYQKIDAQLDIGKKNEIKNLTIYDKSGYVFQAAEIHKSLVANLNLSYKSDSPTQVNLEGEQYPLELRKMIRTALFKHYLNSTKKNMLLSQYALSKSINDVLPEIMNSENFKFLANFIPEYSNRILVEALGKEFETTRNTIHLSESKKEVKLLENKAALIKNILGNVMFDLNDDSILFELIQSIGAKYSNQKLSFINSNSYTVSLDLGKMKLSDQTIAYLSTGFINENEKMLQGILEPGNSDKESIRANAFFLPMIFPKLYEAMSPSYRMTFERLALEAYLKSAEKSHIPFEKSALDYIKLFNAKGFYFQEDKGELQIKSIYSKFDVGVLLPKKTSMYLKSIPKLEELLEGQQKQIVVIRNQGTGKLQNLWISYLIEKQLYDKAAFLLVYDGVRPNLSAEVMEYHMNNGLKNKILMLSNQKVNSQQRMLLRKSVFAFSSIMGKYASEEEVFNGFRDELTDYSTSKNTFV